LLHVSGEHALKHQSADSQAFDALQTSKPKISSTKSQNFPEAAPVTKIWPPQGLERESVGPERLLSLPSSLSIAAFLFIDASSRSLHA
jgi:hypothetical protein